MTEFFDALRNFHNKTPSLMMLSNLKNKLFFIEFCRIIFYTLVILSFVIFQISNDFFIVPHLNTIFYTMLSIAFVLNSIYLIFFHQPKYLLPAVVILFVFDTVFISILVHLTQNTQPIFLFLYLVNILLFSLLFPWKGTFFLAFFTSFLFSILLILNPYIVNTNLAFTLGVNNIAFFSVAFLGSYLSTQMGFMGQQIEHQTQDIHTLQDINTLILETMPSGLIVFDTMGHIIQFNISAKNILEKNLLHLPMSSLFDNMSQHLLSSAYQKTNYASWEENYKAKSHQKQLGLTLTPLKTGGKKWKHLKDANQKENILGHILLIQDLTGIKKLEEVARRNETMAAIGQLAAGIAHEIRNPLASISGSVQLLQTSESPLQGEKRGSDNKKLYAIVLKEIDRLNLLISEFLNYAKPEETPSDCVDINNVLKETLDRIKLNTRLPSHVEQHSELKAKGGIVGQVGKLEQVFLNLIINAYQAMENSHPANLFVNSYNKQDCIFVSVKDTGPGLIPEVKGRIFEPFLTTKSSGTGLGLATTHKILENHGARVHVVSKEGEGVEFLIEFTRLYHDSSKERDNLIYLKERKRG